MGNKEAMGAPLKLTKDKKITIRAIYNEELKANNKKKITHAHVFRLFVKKCRKEIESRNKYIKDKDLFVQIVNEQMKMECPGYDTVSDFVKLLEKFTKEKEEPWLISSLSQNEIPPEVLPKVLEVFIKGLEQPLPVHITVREAKWAGRLAFVLTDPQRLLDFVRSQADYETILEHLKYDMTSYRDVLNLYSNMLQQKTGAGLSAKKIQNLSISAQMAEARKQSVKRRKATPEQID